MHNYQVPRQHAPNHTEMAALVGTWNKNKSAQLAKIVKRMNSAQPEAFRQAPLTEQAARKFLSALGEQAVPQDQWPSSFVRFVECFEKISLALAAALPGSKGELTKLIRLAKEALDDGNLTETQVHLAKTNALLAKSDDASLRCNLLAAQANLALLFLNDEEAARLFEQATATDLNAPHCIEHRLHAGDVWKRVDESAAALKAYRSTRALALAVVKGASDAKPSKVLKGTHGLKSSDDFSAWQRLLAMSHNRIGDIEDVELRGPEALTSYRAGLAIAKQLVETEPENHEILRALATSHQKLANSLCAEDKHKQAFVHYQEVINIAGRMLHSSKPDAQWTRLLFQGYSGLGEAQYEREEFNAAVVSYRAALKVAHPFLSGKPAEEEWLHYTSTLHNALGQSLLALDGEEVALASRLTALELAERLVNNDPENRIWQRNLFDCHEHLQGCRETLGDKAGRLVHLHARLDIATRMSQAALAGSSPEWESDREEWMHDLSDCHIQVGHGYGAMGDVARAFAGFQAALDVALSFAEKASDPSDWQRDIVYAAPLVGRMFDLTPENRIP